MLKHVCVRVYVFVRFCVCAANDLQEDQRRGVRFRFRRRRHHTIASPHEHAHIRAYTMSILAGVDHLYVGVPASPIWVVSYRHNFCPKPAHGTSKQQYSLHNSRNK
uniref:Putative secreted protein n=1 Tax=Ixodes ricinus TaxID=34613 RepID=A0A6B0UGR3_IXORI